MTKQQKLSRLAKDGYIVTEHFFRTIRFTAGKYEAENIYQLFNQIYGY